MNEKHKNSTSFCTFDEGGYQYIGEDKKTSHIEFLNGIFKQINRIRRIAKENGIQGVRRKGMEEAIEFHDALDGNDFIEIIDETTDILNMALQTIEAYGIEKEVLERLEFKLTRTEKVKGII